MQLGKQLVPVESTPKGQGEMYKVSLRKTEAFPAATNPGRYLRPPRRKANQHEEPRRPMERFPDAQRIMHTSANLPTHHPNNPAMRVAAGSGVNEATLKV